MASCIDREAVLEAFIDEIEAGLAGKKSSLAAIPTFIEVEHKMPLGEKVIVLDAGGTHLRICTVIFQQDGEALIENFSKYPMPGIDHEVTAEQFYETLVDYMKHVVHLSDKIGFCFSYATEIMPNRDGKLISFSKEIKIPQLVGKLIGQGLRDALQGRGYGDKQVVILNDTVAALLAGKLNAAANCSGYIGFILGTGTNTAYVEKNEAITKQPGLNAKASQGINLESGNFTKCPRGFCDEQFDATTMTPGLNIFEKMISGAYLGPLSLTALQCGATQGLFSQAASAKLQDMKNLSTITMNDFRINPSRNDSPFSSEFFTNEDKKAIHEIFNAIIDRAALLCAINITSCAIKSNLGDQSVCISIEGSTFYKAHEFPQRAFGYLKEMMDKSNIHYTTTHVDNAPIIGAALAGLSS
ncbi:MAG: hexokinase [Verrucomicrobiota bacterium]